MVLSFWHSVCAFPLLDDVTLEYWGCPLLVLQVQLYDLSQLANARLSVKIIRVKGKDRRFITGQFFRQDRKIIVILAITCGPHSIPSGY